MAATPDNFTDKRRPIDRYLGSYSADHRNGLNQIIHWICVPPIVWTVMAALYVIPVPGTMFRPGMSAGFAMVAAVAYYLRLSRPLGLAMAVAFAVMLAFTWWLYGMLGPRYLLYTAIAVFVIAWVAQFIGHEFEGKRPSFLTDLQYLLIGPLWLTSKLMRKLGIAY